LDNVGLGFLIVKDSKKSSKLAVSFICGTQALQAGRGDMPWVKLVIT
jgi:hypothetical protein